MVIIIFTVLALSYTGYGNPLLAPNTNSLPEDSHVTKTLVRDIDGNPVQSNVLVLDQDGNLVKKLDSTNPGFDRRDGWTLAIEAIESKDLEVLFELTDHSYRPEITIDSYGEKPIKTATPLGTSLKYLEISSSRNLKFKKATLRIHYTQEEITDKNLDEESLRLLHYKEGRWVTVNTTLNTTSNYIEGEVTSLSTFSVVGNYQDDFDDDTISPDWVNTTGSWTENPSGNGYLNQDSGSVGHILNYNATGGYRNYNVSVDIQMSGDTEHWMAVLLRSDGTASKISSALHEYEYGSAAE